MFLLILTAVDPCDNQPCSNGGTCLPDEEDGFVCQCLEGEWTGKTCDIEVEPIGKIKPSIIFLYRIPCIVGNYGSTDI